MTPISFSLLPSELTQEIGSYFSYKDIMSFCHVEKALMDICEDKGFWGSLIAKRFPDYQANFRTTTDIRDFLHYLEQNVYRVTLTYPNKEPLSLTTDEKDIIAVIISVVYLTCSRSLGYKQVCMVDQLKIIKPNGELLTTPEAQNIVKKYTEDVEEETKSPNKFSYKRVTLTHQILDSSTLLPLKKITFGMTILDKASPNVIKNLLKLFEYMGAKDITIKHITT